MTTTTGRIDEFSHWLEGKNCSSNTVRAYRADLRGLFDFLGPTPPETVTLADLERYLGTLAATHTGTTRARKAHTFHAFFGWLARRTKQPSPAGELELPKKEEREAAVLTEHQYRAVRDVVREDPRASAIVEVLLQTGIRVGELVVVLKTDVTWSTPDTVAGLLVRQGKGKKDRWVVLNSTAERALQRYLKTRRRRDPSPHLFVTRTGRPMDPRGVRYLVAKTFRLARIQQGSVHTLRHTFGTHQIQKGTDVIVVQHQMGHASLTTTQKYVHLVRRLQEEQIEANAL